MSGYKGGVTLGEEVALGTLPVVDEAQGLIDELEAAGWRMRNWQTHPPRLRYWCPAPCQHHHIWVPASPKGDDEIKNRRASLYKTSCLEEHP